MGRPTFRRLDYDLFEMLMGAQVPCSTLRILLVIIHFTIGYRRESHWISLSKFEELARLSRNGVVRAIHDAEQRGMVRVERPGTNPRAGNIYAVNTDFSEWVTSKAEYTRTSEPQVTSKLVNHSSPDWCTPVHQTSDIATSATPIERNSNVTLKKSTTTTPLKNTPPENSLEEFTPTSQVTGLEDGYDILTTTHPKDTTPKSSSGRELNPTLAGKRGKDGLLSYLQSNGVCTLDQLKEALGLRYGTVRVYLDALKKAGRVNNPERGRWRAVDV